MQELVRRVEHEPTCIPWIEQPPEKHKACIAPPKVNPSVIDQSLFISLLGISITVVLGLWSIYLASRHRYPGRITFIEEACLGLFDEIVRNLPELSIQFKGSPVKENLVLLKGSVFNDGSKDITTEMVDKRLCAELPVGYKWLAANIVSSSPNVKAQADIEEDRFIEFNLGLFRCGEHFRIEALAEVPDTNQDFDVSHQLRDSIKFSHRIADTGGVRAGRINRIARERIRPLKFSAIAAGIALGLVSLKAVDLRDKPLTIRQGGRLIEVEVIQRSPQFVDLLGIKESFYKRMPSKEFKSLVPARQVQWPAVAGFVAALTLMSFGAIADDWERQRLSRLLGLLYSDSVSLRRRPSGPKVRRRASSQ